MKYCKNLYGILIIYNKHNEERMSPKTSSSKVTFIFVSYWIGIDFKNI